MLHSLRSLNINKYDNSIPTDPPISAYPSSNTVYPEDQTSSPVLGVQPMDYHDAPRSTVNVTDLPPGHNVSLDTTPAHPVKCTWVQ